jgi:hypothetical protein
MSIDNAGFYVSFLGSSHAAFSRALTATDHLIVTGVTTSLLLGPVGPGGIDVSF